MDQIVVNNSNGSSQDQITKCKKSYFCDSCNQSFHSAWNLKRHNQRKHQENNQPPLHKENIETSKRFECCLCGEKYAGSLSTHLKSSHGIDIQTKNLKFENFQMFKSFLEKTEEETYSNYSTRRIVRDSNHQVTYANYICSRRGSMPANRLERKRASKSNKTIKIGNICPSQISLTRNKNGTYTAKWTTTHVGHELDVKFCRLPKKHKELIEHYLKIGLPSSVIKKKMSNLLESCEMITEFEDETNPMDILDPTMSISNEDDTMKLANIENVHNERIKNTMKKINDMFAQPQHDEDHYNELVATISTIFPHLFELNNNLMDQIEMNE
ncbi:hypothetical protein HUG17_9849 [Dermatophagoides farinae]|uniref:C2H2-type domain-containing protein n=1 Tax=Dermatophagoides farinae TaxID=6954 RepID=A0A9D4P371_DERFA|nr:hypothetical protein HUG17_9849 [Dermatophagoides farinae]